MKIDSSNIFVMTIFLIFSLQAYSQWNPDSSINTPICISANVQYSPSGVSDGQGGAIFTWQDKRNGNDWDIYAQRINADGFTVWDNNGVPICSMTDQQEYPTIVADGNGGAIIAWTDKRNTTSGDIYAQKINALGQNEWEINGILVSNITTIELEYNPKIVSNGNGGAIIIWQSANNGNDIYCQNISSSGEKLWEIDGVPVCTNSEQQSSSEVVSDMNGGAIVTWQDYRNGNFDVYCQRINNEGIIQWAIDGLSVCNLPSGQSYPKLTSDNDGGAIITWSDGRTSTATPDIYAQRVSSTGAMLWTSNGSPVSTTPAAQNSPVIVSDGLGGAIIGWDDWRTSANAADVYIQRIDSSGNALWTENGVATVSLNNNQWYPKILPDNIGGATICWWDQRQGSFYDIYAQFINSSGVPQWSSNGVAIATAANDQSAGSIIATTGGAIIGFADGRNGTSDVYAQKVNSSGTLNSADYILNDVSVYPNPCRDLLMIDSISKINRISISELTGKTVYESTSLENISLGHLSKGVYLYIIDFESGQVQNGKLVIQ